MDEQPQTQTEWIYKDGFGWVQRDAEAARILEGDVEAWLRANMAELAA